MRESEGRGMPKLLSFAHWFYSQKAETGTLSLQIQI